MLKKYTIHLFIFLFILGTCPFSIYSQQPDPYLKISEDSLTSSNYREAISFLEKNVLLTLKNSKDLNEVMYDSEFWISYFNSLKIIHGYVLKMQVSIENISKKKHSKKAKEEYKKFLENTYYSD